MSDENNCQMVQLNDNYQRFDEPIIDISGMNVTMNVSIFALSKFDEINMTFRHEIFSEISSVASKVILDPFIIFFFKKWANPGLFFVYFGLLKQTI